MRDVMISLAFKKLSVALAAVFGQSILTAMSNNTNFTNPFPVLTDLQSAVNNLKTAIANQHKGDKASTSAVKDAKRELNRVLKVLAAYVEYISKTDETMALTSGFSLVLPRPAVANVFAAVQGLQSGSVEVSCPANGKSYIWRYLTDPIVDANWLVASITAKASFTINGLNPGTKYWFRVATITKDGQQPWDNPMMVHVV